MNIRAYIDYAVQWCTYVGYVENIFAGTLLLTGSSESSFSAFSNALSMFFYFYTIRLYFSSKGASVRRRIS